MGTPDCCGKICSIHIYDETGHPKNVIQKDKDKREIKGLSILAKQKKKKEKKERRTAKNESRKKNKNENQNDANKENRDDKENVKEEVSSKKDNLGTNQHDDQKTRSIIPISQHNSQSSVPVLFKKERAPTTPSLPIDPESSNRESNYS